MGSFSQQIKSYHGGWKKRKKLLIWCCMHNRMPRATSFKVVGPCAISGYSFPFFYLDPEQFVRAILICKCNDRFDTASSQPEQDMSDHLVIGNAY